MDRRQRAIQAVREFATGNIEKHRYNVDVYLNSPVGIGEHPDVLDAIQTELHKMAEYDDILEVLDKYFKD
jgi:hypothetical protein